MKILILRFSSIGDIVLTSPVVRCLKKAFPHAQIHYCTKRRYRELICHNPHINTCQYVENNLWELFGRLRAEKYDVVIDLHNNLRSNLIKHFLGKQVLTFHKINGRKWLYVRLKLNLMPDVHVVDRYIDTLRPLGIINDGAGLDHFIGPNEQVPLSALPLAFRAGYVAYALGGEHATKRLPTDRMIELCRSIDKPVVLLGGSADRLAGETIRTILGDDRIYNACGLFTLNQSASLIKQAARVYSHDTGLMHVAAAFKKNIVSIWGNTTPQLGMYPYKTTYQVIENNTLSCRPCSKIGYDRCPLGHFKCMNELTFTADAN